MECSRGGTSAIGREFDTQLPVPLYLENILTLKKSKQLNLTSNKSSQGAHNYNEGKP